MKVYIKCKSPLLQRSLEIFLEDFTTSKPYISNFYISDKKIKDKKTFVVGKDIFFPFTKKELLSTLEKYYKDITSSQIEDSLKNALNEIKKVQSKKIDKLAKRLS